MTDTHTATKPVDQGKAQPLPDAEREPNLQDMLAEYDESNPATTQPQPKTEERVAPQSAAQTPDTSDDDIKDWVRQKREQEMRETTDKAVTDAVGFLREADETLSDMPDRVATGLLYAEAANNPDFAKAFALRQRSPQIWNRALKDLASSVADEFTSKPDSKLTADREAARASVRGTTQTRSDPDDAQKKLEQDVSTMGGAEFEEFKKSLKNR